jgi:uncharacterized protein YndB with AHSA1/START domain
MKSPGHQKRPDHKVEERPLVEKLEVEVGGEVVAPAITATVSMLIRRPAAEVFRAITAPDILTKFWLARASGPLEVGKRVRRDFMVKGVSDEVLVKEIVRDRQLLTELSDGTTVTWQLTSREDATTVIEVKQAGFKGTPGEVATAALGSTQGYTIVLCALKTLLERGDPMNLVHDKAALIEQSRSL